MENHREAQSSLAVRLGRRTHRSTLAQVRHAKSFTFQKKTGVWLESVWKRIGANKFGAIDIT
jgi:hypothetical protein